MNEGAERILAAASAAAGLLCASTPDSDGAGLLAAHTAVADLRRVVDGVLAGLSAEIARRSRPELGSDSLARRNGFRNAGALVSAATGTSQGEAQRMIQVGAATAPRPTLTGELRAAKHPHVGVAMSTGSISVLAASLIVTMLDRVELCTDAAARVAMERTLVDQSRGLTLDQVAKRVARAEAHLDPNGLEPKLEELHTKRSLVIRQDPSGMVVLLAHLDPETAAPVKAAIEGIVTAQLRRHAEPVREADAGGHADGVATDAAGHGEGEGAGAGATDPRSITQMQADALVELCRHLLGCDMSKALTHATTTVVVRVDLDTLRSGTGVATIDGLDQPISAGAARRMAAAASVIPCVLGGAGEIVDWGRSRRLFTTAQRLALLERDGGCAFCGAPPGLTEAHHIRWWLRDGGPTDLSNGVMLCSSCHHRIHSDGWGIRVTGVGRDAAVWFDPPRHIDPSGTPRLGGRRRFDLVA